MRRVIRHRGWPVAFNMTPLIDIIFQLIIFFLAVNQFQKAESDTTVRLPRASPEHVATQPPAQPSRLVINVRPEEGMFVSGREVEIDQLATILEQQRKSAAPEPLEVWIRADRGVPYGRVEPILLACARTGVWKVAFKVITTDGPRGGSDRP